MLQAYFLPSVTTFSLCHCPRIMGLAVGFLLSGSGIFTCASPVTASLKLSGY
jgi:hypothetical protein